MPTILIVDDEYLIADILGYALEDEGYKAFTASNGKRALEIFDSESPALVITDFMMPGMNGLELAQKIRSHASLGSVPILLMSGAQGGVGRATPELFNAVYDKPFDINKVVARIRELVPLDPD
ncbi:response regulator transcription factor [Pseudomonas sp. CFBP 13727]|uniref:response regulator transcription factor n=1 Tax=Pseudomonas sp. CFBP 13727 TaxID=2775295 RepID=UPI00178495FF|nr:response regulator [Pseudomonas sp. CFBP 13727]MBD8621885.1 response regulator [Pseudomonas sp. CFBP 13727]